MLLPSAKNEEILSQWIRLKSAQMVKRELCKAGEWVYIGNQKAEEFVAEGKADYGPKLATRIDGNAGVIYVVYGAKALKMAKESINSIRYLHPDLQIAIISNSDPRVRGTAFIYHSDDDAGARIAKLNVYDLTPFERTLYLDADTVVISSLAGGFNLLNYFDLALASDLTMIDGGILAGETTYLQEERTATAQELPTDKLTQYACGMMFFKKTHGMTRLFTKWQYEWQRWRWRDQGAFLRAIHKVPVRHIVLPKEWNMSGTRGATAVVHHKWGAARREGQ